MSPQKNRAIRYRGEAETVYSNTDAKYGWSEAHFWMRTIGPVLLYGGGVEKRQKTFKKVLNNVKKLMGQNNVKI